MERVYLAARYGAKEQVENLASKLRAAGHEVVSTWHRPGSMTGSYAVASKADLEHESRIDKADMHAATTFVALEHLGDEGSRGGRHFEFGFCYAMHKPCAVTCFEDTPLNLYHQQVDRICVPFEENLVAWLDALRTDHCTQARIREQCKEIADMLVQKNKSYGDSALHPTGIFAQGKATELLRVRMDDKLNRIKNSPDAFGEDVVLDLIGYLVLYKLALEDEQK